MAKPTTLPEWATGGTAQIVQPTSGKKAAGHAPGERPPAQYENWWKKLTLDWLAYLDAGALEGNHSIDGNLTVEGVTTLNDALEATGGITVGANQHVAVSGAGEFKHGDIPIIVSAIDSPLILSGSIFQNYWQASGAGQFHQVVLPLRPGDRLKSINWAFRNGGSPGSAKTFAVYRTVNAAPSIFEVVTGWSHSHTGAAATDGVVTQTGNQTGGTYTVATNEALVLRFTSGDNSDRFYNAKVIYDRP